MPDENTENTAQEPQDATVAPEDAQDPTEPQEDATEPQDGAQDDPETFPRSYVQELRDENARYRQRAARAADLAAALWTARVTATARLADPTDLTMPEDADPLDADTVTAAVDELLARKPHLASRRPVGDVGQGTTSDDDGVSLAGILRARAS